MLVSPSMAVAAGQPAPVAVLGLLLLRGAAEHMSWLETLLFLGGATIAFFVSCWLGMLPATLRTKHRCRMLEAHGFEDVTNGLPRSFPRATLKLINRRFFSRATGTRGEIKVFVFDYNPPEGPQWTGVAMRGTDLAAAQAAIQTLGWSGRIETGWLVCRSERTKKLQEIQSVIECIPGNM